MVAVSTKPPCSLKGSHRDALHFAFVACNRNAQLFQQDPAFICLCENWGLALQEIGHYVTWMYWTALCPLQRFDVVVFHRPRYSLRWRTLLWRLKRNDTTLIAEVEGPPSVIMTNFFKGK